MKDMYADDLKTAKAGQRVVLVSVSMMGSQSRRIETIFKATPKLIEITRGKYRRDDGTKYADRYARSRIAVATEADVRAFDKAATEEEERKHSEKAFKDRLDVKLADRLANKHGWLLLGLDKLQRIVAIIDEP